MLECVGYTMARFLQQRLRKLLYKKPLGENALLEQILLQWQGRLYATLYMDVFICC